MNELFRRPDQGSSVRPGRDPMAAAALSIVPGLGQLYNGQQAKGFLFFDVAVVNFVILWMMLFTEPIVRALMAFSNEFHFRPNNELLRVLNQMHLGTPMANVVLLLILGFIWFAARDAYDSAKSQQRKALYWDSIIGMPEAASGSYLLHFAGITALALLALFLILPPAPRSQVTDIEFVTNDTDSKTKEETKRQSNKNSISTAKFTPNHEARQELHRASAARPAESSHQAAPAHAAPMQRQAESAPPPPTVAPRPIKPTLMAMAAPHIPVPSAVSQPTAPAVKMPTPTAIGQPAQSHAVSPMPLPQAASAVGQAAPMPTLQKMAVPGGSVSMPRALQQQPKTGSGAPGPIVPVVQGGPVTTPTPASTESFSAHGSGVPGHSNAAPSPSRSHGPANGDRSIAVAPVGAAPGRDLTDQQAIGDKASVRDGKTIGSRKNVDFGAYMALLQRRIKSRWTPPRVPDSKRVQLIFKISPTGELLDLNLARSCGIAESDQAAMKAVREAAPFPHLPAGADEAVDIEFTFDYNVFNGGVRGGLGF